MWYNIHKLDYWAIITNLKQYWKPWLLRANTEKSRQIWNNIHSLDYWAIMSNLKQYWKPRLPRERLLSNHDKSEATLTTLITVQPWRIWGNIDILSYWAALTNLKVFQYNRNFSKYKHNILMRIFSQTYTILLSICRRKYIV